MKIKICSKHQAGFANITSALVALLLVQAVLLGGLLAWRTRMVIQTAGREEITSAMFILGGSILAVFVAGCGFTRKQFNSFRRPVIRRRQKEKAKEKTHK